MNDFEIRFRKLSEIEVYGGKQVVEGDRIWFNDFYRDALLANPFVTSLDMACQKVGYVDGRVGGTEISFPLLIRADGRIRRAGSGSLLVVDQWARKSGLGIALSGTDYNDTASGTEIGEGAGLSQIAVRVHRYLEYTVFEYPRFMALWKSRAVVERYVTGFCARILQRVFDACLRFYGWLLAAVAWFNLRGYDVVPVRGDDDAGIATIASFTDMGGHRFSEVHDDRWLKWHLNHSFSQYGPAKAFLVCSKSDEKPVAFYMTKRRFHEQASGRGFKNVWLGSVLEWGCSPGFEKILKWAIVHAVVAMRNDTDTVEFPTDDASMQKFAKRLGWRPVGNANFCFKAVDAASDLAANQAMRDRSNWRLRPAMGDYGMN